jgi:hypothetical protein
MVYAIAKVSQGEREKGQKERRIPAVMPHRHNILYRYIGECHKKYLVNAQSTKEITLIN